MTQGLFISFEGVEGSGKSTQLRLLAKHLEAGGREVVRTREPGGTPTGDRVREVLLDPSLPELEPVTEMLLFAAGRAQHVRQLVRPALARGAVVLCDRYLHSSLAYQAWARGLGRAAVLAANAPAVDGLLPDRVLLLDLSVEVAFARARDRGALDRIERAGRPFHDAVRAGFHAERDLDPTRFVTIDGSGPEEAIHRAVVACVDALMEERS